MDVNFSEYVCRLIEQDLQKESLANPAAQVVTDEAEMRLLRMVREIAAEKVERTKAAALGDLAALGLVAEEQASYDKPKG